MASLDWSYCPFFKYADVVALLLLYKIVLVCFIFYIMDAYFSLILLMLYFSVTKLKYGSEVWKELPADWLEGLNVKTQVDFWLARRIEC